MSRPVKITINPKRIDWCCDQVGEEVEDVLKKVGIRASVSPDQITYLQLQKIADYFERGVYFFTKDTDPSEETDYSGHFRNLVKQKKLDRKARNLIRRIENQRLNYIDFLEELEVEDPPELDRYDDIDDAAQEVRELLGIDEFIAKNGKIEFKDYRQAVEQLGVFVILSNRYKGKWYLEDQDESAQFIGFSIYHKKFPVIFVKSEIHEKRQVFTLMHELGHLLLHQKDRIDSYADIHGFSARKAGKQEKDANRFAARILIPNDRAQEARELIDPVLDEVPMYYKALKEMSDRLQVSEEAIILRMADAGLIGNDKYEEYCRNWKNISKLEKQKKGVWGPRDRAKEAKTIFGENYVNAVLASYHGKLITLFKAAVHLDIQVEDVLALNR